MSDPGGELMAAEGMMTSFPWGGVKGGPATPADASPVSSERPQPGISAEAAAEAEKTAGLVAENTPVAAGNNSPGAASPGAADASSGVLAAREAMVEHTPGRVNDAELIREAQRGNRAAFEELVRLYDQAVLRLALRLTGSEQEARDIYQEADERSGASPERDLLRRELGARIASALEKLTPRERLVFEMKHFQGLRLRTIGEALNTTEETAKNTLFRATQKLRAALADAR
jgi:DNA-directed RNA polymerase specialized sigma24 family protein